ncbi:hypothetical protein [Consotaella salsifontis]|uniref:Uncharacterized protein n=1 Tax=Consotaella salsifontis TaxID=1365950 RepID=A0A1T4QY42_9HYPH|nr:hypothetical protein [Consotaella salsifontis]SKA08709.1 hypothetical protein SAMN05428963_105347 [Consotaella salsifontis]
MAVDTMVGEVRHSDLPDAVQRRRERGFSDEESDLARSHAEAEALRAREEARRTRGELVPAGERAPPVLLRRPRATHSPPYAKFPGLFLADLPLSNAGAPRMGGAQAAAAYREVLDDAPASIRQPGVEILPPLVPRERDFARVKPAETGRSSPTRKGPAQIAFSPGEVDAVPFDPAAFLAAQGEEDEEPSFGVEADDDAPAFDPAAFLAAQSGEDEAPSFAAETGDDEPAFDPAAFLAAQGEADEEPSFAAETDGEEPAFDPAAFLAAHAEEDEEPSFGMETDGEAPAFDPAAFLAAQGEEDGEPSFGIETDDEEPAFDPAAFLAAQGEEDEEPSFEAETDDDAPAFDPAAFLAAQGGEDEELDSEAEVSDFDPEAFLASVRKDDED